MGSIENARHWLFDAKLNEDISIPRDTKLIIFCGHHLYIEPFSQPVVVYDTIYNPLFLSRGSSLPNPYVPQWSKGSVPSGTKLPDAYPMVAEGKHWGIYSITGHNGKPGISLYDNNKCPIAQPINPQTNLTYATHIDIHSGFTTQWRGSAGCLTIHPDDWKKFCNCFMEGERVDILVPSPWDVLDTNKKFI